MSVLVVKNIGKAFQGVHAVKDLSFSVEPGTICGFIGPNGAGKTTTMRIIATLLLPDSGMVWVDGHSVLTHPREVRASIGFMPDHFEMEDALTVSELIEFYASAHGLRGEAKRRAIQDAVDFTGLGPLMEKQSTSLSKGMRQRAALAVTMIHDPKLLILDEPAAGLDPRARIELRALLQVIADMGKAVLISSHILAELSEICDQVVVLEKGRLMGDQNVQDLQSQSAQQTSIYVQATCSIEHLHETLIGYPKVEDALVEEGGVVINIQGGVEERVALLSYLIEQKVPVYGFASRDLDLEDLFLSLTKGDVQ